VLLVANRLARKSLFAHICLVLVITVLKRVNRCGIYNVLWQLVPNGDDSTTEEVVQDLCVALVTENFRLCSLRLYPVFDEEKNCWRVALSLMTSF